jgi:hypothetical protein
MDGPWDVKCVLGTVPVEEDGSALFRVPVYTPVAVQPLDEEGRSLLLMRGWFAAMPGEVLSCLGGHEAQNTVTLNRPTIAARHAPANITPWHGPVRGFCFRREVPPVLDKYGVAWHFRVTGMELTSMITSFYLCVLCGAIIVIVSRLFPQPLKEEARRLVWEDWREPLRGVDGGAGRHQRQHRRCQHPHLPPEAITRRVKTIHGIQATVNNHTAWGEYVNGDEDTASKWRGRSWVTQNTAKITSSLRD